MNTNVNMIPLSKLAAWKGNVRKTHSESGVVELAESIAVHGLLQSLVIAAAPVKGKHQVIAGRRRLFALQSLAKAGRIEADLPVPCAVATDGIDLSELSLAENVMRVAMHPADEFEAFKSLIGKGASIADVASRFSVTETAVIQRLKLGRLSPKVLEAYRDEEIDLEQAKAFAISDDCEAQERVLAALPHMHGSPPAIRRALTDGEVSTDDRRVLFVGLDAYVAAGGGLRRDLFAEFSDTLTDSVLLDRLVAEKLSLAAEEIKSEGWSWVETLPERDYGAFADYWRESAEQAELPEDKRAELEALRAELDAIAGSDDDDDMQRLSDLETQIEDIEESCQYWSQQTLDIAGAIVSIGYDGELLIERGLVRNSDQRKDAIPRTDTRGPAGVPASLLADLTAQKTLALQACLMQRPDVALASVIHSLGAARFFGRRSPTALQISSGTFEVNRHMRSPEASRALGLLSAAHDDWCAKLPASEDDFWDWCLSQTREVLLELLAYLSAVSTNAVQLKTDTPESARLVDADALARSVSLDMSDWFSATADGYFSRINSSQIIAALSEAKGVPAAPGWAKLKKVELANLAEREIHGTGWLPQPLRHHNKA